MGGLLEVSYHGTAITNAFVAYDGNGNVSALVNAADGTMVANYEYSPFGETIRSTGSLAKNNPFRFSTKYDDDESDFLYYGYRYYKASTGTWLSRDPAGEDESENLYQIAGNDTSDLIDVLGLEWQVFRILQNRADAFGTCGDTIRELANKIHLDPDDYEKWLQSGSTGDSIPSSVDTPLDGMQWFTVPNKAYVNDLVYWLYPIPTPAWKQWRRKEETVLYREGYKVIHVDKTLKAQFLAQLNDPDVQGIITLAHGDPDYQGDFSDAGPDYVTPDEAAASLNHKLAGFKAIWCWSGVKREGWRKIVSPSGYLYTYPHEIHQWQAWPGFVRHGLPDN